MAETIFAKRQKDKNRRATLKAKGICIACASERVGLNLDGTKSVRCETCQIKCTGRRHKKPTPKYDFNKSTPRTGEVDAPDFRESDEYKAIAVKVTGIVFQFGDVSAGNITRLIVGDMEKGYARQRIEGYVASAIESLVSANVIEPFGVLRVLYRKATPVERKVEAVDSQKQNEYKAYQRQVNESYPTYASNF